MHLTVCALFDLPKRVILYDTKRRFVQKVTFLWPKIMECTVKVPQNMRHITSCSWLLGNSIRNSSQYSSSIKCTNKIFAHSKIDVDLFYVSNWNNDKTKIVLAQRSVFPIGPSTHHLPQSTFFIGISLQNVRLSMKFHRFRLEINFCFCIFNISMNCF